MRQSKNYQTVCLKLLATKNYNSGMSLIRQIEFSLFDFILHMDQTKNKRNLADKVLKNVRKETSLIPAHKSNKFQNSFAHISQGLCGRILQL